MELRKKVEWRTEVALRQERALIDSESDNAMLIKQLAELELSAKKSDESTGSHEIVNKIRELKDATDRIEQKYQQSKTFKKINHY